MKLDHHDRNADASASASGMKLGRPGGQIGQGKSSVKINVWDAESGKPKLLRGEPVP